MVSPLLGIERLIHARVSDIEPDPLPEGRRYRVRRVDPTVGVENILGDVLGVDAVDGVADVLLGRHDERESEHAGGGDRVVESEHPRVDVNVANAEQPAKLAEDLQHGGSRGQ